MMHMQPGLKIGGKAGVLKQASDVEQLFQITLPGKDRRDDLNTLEIDTGTTKGFIILDDPDIRPNRAGIGLCLIFSHGRDTVLAQQCGNLVKPGRSARQFARTERQNDFQFDTKTAL